MKMAIVYHSAGGNTKALADMIASYLPQASLFTITDFDPATLSSYAGLLVGTYTWGDGELPVKMVPFYKELEAQNISHLVTGIFGTGETNYHHFCGAVNQFRDMLYVHSTLAVTLKIEQMFQASDVPKIQKFTNIFKQAVHTNSRHLHINKRNH